MLKWSNNVAASISSFILSLENTEACQVQGIRSNQDDDSEHAETIH